MTDNAKQPIPTTPMVRLYRQMRQMSQAERLEMAGDLSRDANSFARQLGESIEDFRPYNNPAEAFCRPHAALARPVAIVGGRSLAAEIAQRECAVSGDRQFRFSFVDYEVRPARTTAKARCMLNRFDDGRLSRTTMSIDLLLQHEDGTPIVGEAKVAREKGYDTDSVLALIQALAGATQFGTANQRLRLTQHYPGAFAQSSILDVAVIAYLPPRPAKARYQGKLDTAARTLAEGLLASGDFPAELRHIRFVTARGMPGSLEFQTS